MYRSGFVSTLHIDLGELSEMLGDDPEAINRLLQIAECEVPKQCIELENVFASGDRFEVKRLAHTMIGTLSALGAANAVILLKDIEFTSDSDDVDKARALFKKLLPEIPKIMREIGSVREAMPLQ